MLSTPLAPNCTPHTQTTASLSHRLQKRNLSIPMATLKQVWNGVFRYNVAARGWVWLAVLRSLFCYVMFLMFPSVGRLFCAPLLLLFWFYWGNDDFGRENGYPPHRTTRAAGDCATIKCGEVNVELVKGFEVDEMEWCADWGVRVGLWCMEGINHTLKLLLLTYDTKSMFRG